MTNAPGAFNKPQPMQAALTGLLSSSQLAQVHMSQRMQFVTVRCAATNGWRQRRQWGVCRAQRTMQTSDKRQRTGSRRGLHLVVVADDEHVGILNNSSCTGDSAAAAAACRASVLVVVVVAIVVGGGEIIGPFGQCHELAVTEQLHIERQRLQRSYRRLPP
jgi:hypothetical protein